MLRGSVQLGTLFYVVSSFQLLHFHDASVLLVVFLLLAFYVHMVGHVNIRNPI